MAKRIAFGLLAIAAMAGCQSQLLSKSAPTTRPGEPEVIGTAPPTYPAATPERVVAVTQRISPAVVRIDVAQTIYKDGKPSFQRGTGSGVIIDNDGHILTNYHVAGRATEIYVVLADKERVPAKLVGDDHWTDLAIVRMDMDEVKQKKITFSTAELGDSSAVIVGQDAIAFGTPFGFARTVTRGSISNTDRTLGEHLDIDGYETGLFSNWIQMDVPINPGNSGGPLVDLNGKVIGINTRGGGQNLNFAIPIDTAKQVIAALLKTGTPTKKGRVDRSDLGVDLKPMQDLEQFYDIDVNKGVLINSIERSSPAMEAGVHSQDILLAINGEPTNVRFPEELAAVNQRIADLPIGTEVKLTVKRGKENLDLTAKTELLQGYLGDEKGFAVWGVSVRPVTRPYANRNQLDDAMGVWITTEAPGLPAEKAELQPGDVIRSVNTKPVKDLETFQQLYDASVKHNDAKVLVEVQRDQGRFNKVLDIAKYGPGTTEPTE